METKVKCLIVDDLEENLLAMSALLRADDVEVLQANSGTQALELLLANEVALALLDVQMPEMDGFELAELMRGSERTRDVPIIFITAGSRDQHRLFKGYETGAVDFLYKPIDPWILRNKAEVFFQLHRQRQQIAHELAERTETLRLNEMFMAVLGHDLRNPLGAILMHAHLLQRQSAEESTRETAGQILASGKRMRRLITDLLDLARSRFGGGIPIQPEELDLGDIVRRVVRECRASFDGRDIDVASRGDLRGEWDAERVSQVLSNLLSNALRHGRQDEPVAIDVDGTDADRVVFTVRNGGRLPPELIPSLFDPFRGAGHSTDSSPGLGLGLFIVREILRAHGGNVEASGSDDQTCFTVVLPRKP
jgi:two-component system, sensor histidine kinase and response regulator